MRAAGALDALPLFAGLSAKSRRSLSAAGLTRAFASGETLFHAGTAPAGIYIVLSGRVRVIRSRRGRQYVVHTEATGGTLAEVPFFEGGLLPATAIAIEPTHCLVVNSDALRAVIRDDPAVAWLFLSRLSARVRELVERLDRVSTQAISARLASHLLTRARSRESRPFTLGLTQAQLAEELGTVRELVVRALARLRADGVIASAGRGRYEVRDPEALARLSSS